MYHSDFKNIKSDLNIQYLSLIFNPNANVIYDVLTLLSVVKTNLA